MKLNKLSFDDLPPRVVIHDILTYYTFKIDERCYSFCLFGFFHKDRTRGIWFVFSSLKIMIKDWEKVVATFCFPKIHSLQLHTRCTVEFLRRIKQESKKMFSLKKLEFHAVEIENEVFGNVINDLFDEEKCFPNLKSFTMNTPHPLPESNNWHDRIDVFSKLDELRLFWSGNSDQRSLGSINPLFFTRSIKKDGLSAHLLLSNIKKAEFRYVKFSDQITVVLPNLEYLRINRCENFWVIPPPPENKLKHFLVYGMDMKYVEKVYCLGQNLETFKVFVNPDDRLETTHNHKLYSSFLNEKTNLLKNLKSIQLFGIEMREKSKFDFWVEHLAPQLEEMFIVHGDTMVHNIDSNLTTAIILDALTDVKYPKLKVLNCGLHLVLLMMKGSKWHCSLNVVRMELRSFVTDAIFIENHWPCLRELSIRMYSFTGDVDKCTGKGWNVIPNLERFEMSGIPKFEDNFFQIEQNVRGLKELCLDNYEDGQEINVVMKGIDWHPRFYETVEKLQFRRLRNIEDSFFTRVEFSNLRILRLYDMEKLKGDGWKRKYESFEEVERRQLP